MCVGREKQQLRETENLLHIYKVYSLPHNLLHNISDEVEAKYTCYIELCL